MEELMAIELATSEWDLKNRFTVLAVLLTIDTVLILADFLWGVAHILDIMPGRPKVLMISYDHGIAETWNILKWAAATTVLMAAAMRACQAATLLLALPTLLMMLDDWLMVHEQMGGLFGQMISRESSVSYITGEIVFALLFACVVYGLLILAWILGDDRSRPAITRFAVLYVALGAFGVGIDALHSLYLEAIGGYSSTEAFVGLVEDGGEMLIISIITFVALSLWVRPSAIKPYSSFHGGADDRKSDGT